MRLLAQKEIGMRIRRHTTVVLLMLFLSLSNLFAAENGAGQRQAVPDGARKAAELFPETAGSLSLREKVSARPAGLGVELVTYDVMQGEKRIGEVTRIVSLMPEEPAAAVDMLVRYDDNGAVLGIVPLKAWQDAAGSPDITRLLWSFRGKDPRIDAAALTNMIAGVAAGTALADGMAPPAPEGGYPLTVKQLLLEPGARLPALKVTDLGGKLFDLSTYNTSKLLIVFLSPDGPRSGEMAQAIESLAAPAPGNRKVPLLHVIAAPAEAAAAYAGTLGLKSPAAADPAGLLARMFQVPYTPYLFLFNRGILTAPVRWEGEQALRDSLKAFLNDGTSGVKGGAK